VFLLLLTILFFPCFPSGRPLLFFRSSNPFPFSPTFFPLDNPKISYFNLSFFRYELGGSQSFPGISDRLPVQSLFLIRSVWKPFSLPGVSYTAPCHLFPSVPFILSDSSTLLTSSSSRSILSFLLRLADVVLFLVHSI